MKYVTLAYGNADPWGRMLDAWLKNHVEVNGPEPVAVVSRGEDWVGWHLAQAPCPVVEIVGSVDPELVRGNLNISGLLLAEAARFLAPCLVVTLDCEWVRPVIPGEWMQSGIALGLDHFIRGTGQVHRIEGRDIREHSCAVQWCGVPEIGDAFDEAWKRNLEDERSWKIPCWEQVIWSVVWDEWNHVGRAALYPQEMNWSAGVHEGDAAVQLRHYHGARKERLYQKWGIYA